MITYLKLIFWNVVLQMKNKNILKYLWRDKCKVVCFPLPPTQINKNIKHTHTHNVCKSLSLEHRKWNAISIIIHFHAFNYQHLCNHDSHIHTHQTWMSLYQSMLNLTGTLSLIFQYFTNIYLPPLPSFTAPVFSQNFSNLFWLFLLSTFQPAFVKSPSLANFVSNNIYQMSFPSFPTKALCWVHHLWPGLLLQQPSNWLSCL